MCYFPLTLCLIHRSSGSAGGCLNGNMLHMICCQALSFRAPLPAACYSSSNNRGKPSDRQDMNQMGVLLRQSGDAQGLVRCFLKFGKLETFVTAHLVHLCKTAGVKATRFQEKNLGMKSRVPESSVVVLSKVYSPSQKKVSMNLATPIAQGCRWCGLTFRMRMNRSRSR